MNKSRRNKIRYHDYLAAFPHQRKDLEKLESMNLTEEYVKVKNKQSTQPRQMRDLIVFVYENQKKIYKGKEVRADEVEAAKKENFIKRIVREVLKKWKRR